MRPLFIPLLALLMAAASAVNAANYYVSNTGNDANPGTAASPFATIQFAANTALAGDTVFVAPGTYTEVILTNTHSGTATAPIVFKRQGTGAVNIDGGGAAAYTGYTLWTVTNVSHLVIDGFTFRNVLANFAIGLVIRQNSSYINVRNCRFTNICFSPVAASVPTADSNASPLIVYNISATAPATGITFYGNEVFACRTGFSEGITINGNVDGFLVDSNLVHDITSAGIDAAGHWGVCPDPVYDQARNGRICRNTVYNCASPVSWAGGIYVDGGRDIVVENNRTYSNEVGISIGCEKVGKATSGITVRNNVSYGNSVTGIAIGGYDYPANSGKVTASNVLSNTLYKNDVDDIWAGEMNVTYCEGLTVKNNLLYSENANKVIFNYYPANGAGNTFNYNLYYAPSGEIDCKFTYSGTGYGSFGAYKAGTGNDINSIFKEPKLVSPASGNFHISLISPALNAGDPAYVPGPTEKDMDGEARVYIRADCGADEVYYTVSTPLATPVSLNCHPNPATGTLTLTLPATTAASATYTITSLTGSQLMTGPMHGATATIDVSTLPAGSYIISVQQEDSVYRAMFVHL